MPTQKDYFELIRMCELGGWRWGHSELPTEGNYWNIFESKTVVSVKRDLDYDDINYFNRINEGIIKLSEFYKIQKFTPKKVFEINYWFDKILPLINGAKK